MTHFAGRQWTYQTCTEFGFFQSSNYTPQNFGDKFPVDFFIQQCVDIFGPKYNKAFLDTSVRRTNTLYGALNIDVTNVVFVHGSIDPWHALGITQTQRQGAPAIYIKGMMMTLLFVCCLYYWMFECYRYRSLRKYVSAGCR